ncbi:endonuclease 8-like 1 isoform X2 [Elgaria multicarinata webbii]|uniref:endonuclease 8-like 1 isoform X2 n=1 Tax=Elgaria multicarinata webbii TaxID=159646 RepID=UPI002FCD34FD
MPEGPELFLTGQYINAECGGLVFSGKVEKSELCPAPGQKAAPAVPTDLVFRFGMSGCFKLFPAAEVPKHAHLRFYTRERPPRALCYVDVRRFGRWEVGGGWQADRGPCVMLEYERFRENVLRNLSDKAFDKPICEALLNQRFFNGIGNYLRAEILYRLKIPPFEKARTVLEDLQHREQTSGRTLSQKVKLKRENPDLLELCHMVPMEVIRLGGKGYDPANATESTAFSAWLQCYYVRGMKSLSDANGRTIWFQGDPGPMAPKEGKSRKKRLQVKSDPDTLSPKVTKPGVRRTSRVNAPREGATGTRKLERKKRGKTVQEPEDPAGLGGTRRLSTRARRSSGPQESPLADSPAGSRKRRQSARINRAQAAATPRSRRVKAQ